MTLKLGDQPVDEARVRLVDVRRDLVFLVAESRRRVFRPVVADAVCTALLTEVSQGLPARTRKAVLAVGGAA
jgi:hypothetical protein